MSDIQDLIYSKLGTDESILIKKDRQVGATTFLLECCKDFEKLGKKCLFVCWSKDNAKYTKEKLVKNISFDVVSYSESIRGKKYDVIVFDEVPDMSFYKAREIIKYIGTKCLKIFTITTKCPVFCDYIRYELDLDYFSVYINKTIQFKPAPEKPVEFSNNYCALFENEKYLSKLLRNRLGDLDGEVYNAESLYIFLDQSVSMFNSIPSFTDYDLDDSKFVRIFADIIVQGALVLALGSQALKEVGREGVQESACFTYTPHFISDILQQQYNKEIDSWFEKIKLIKSKPTDLSLITKE